MGDNNMVALDEDIVDNGMRHNSQCWSNSAVSQVLISFISLNKKKLSHPLKIFFVKYMHLHAYYPEWHFKCAEVIESNENVYYHQGKG